MGQFLKYGYEVIENVIPPDWRETLIAELPKISNAGSRKLLDYQIFRDTVSYIRNHPQLSQPLSELVAVQCTFFRKTKSHNWSINLHRDVVIPVVGEGEWHNAGYKEGIHFVRPPRHFLDRCLAVRISLDYAYEGDLYVIPNSHSEQNEKIGTKENATLIKVFRHGALVMRPTILHGSSKLKNIESRRIVHYLFAPAKLPSTYFWYHKI